VFEVRSDFSWRTPHEQECSDCKHRSWSPGCCPSLRFSLSRGSISCKSQEFQFRDKEVFEGLLTWNIRRKDVWIEYPWRCWH
jgi:sulfatase maturation enzyme AslB (radical SAM superfamily)